MGYRVLIVDDSSVMRKIVRRNLRQTGIQVDQEFEAEDGYEALAVLANKNVDIVLCDVNMPNLDGISFVKQVRKKPELNDLRIVMITSEAGFDIVNNAISAGANAYIIKPFTAEHLLEKIETAIEE